MDIIDLYSQPTLESIDTESLKSPSQITIPPRITKETAKRLKNMLSKDNKSAPKILMWLVNVDFLYSIKDRYRNFLHPDGGLEAVKKIVSEHPEYAPMIVRLIRQRYNQANGRKRKIRKLEQEKEKIKDYRLAEILLSEQLEKIA